MPNCTGECQDTRPSSRADNKIEDKPRKCHKRGEEEKSSFDIVSSGNIKCDALSLDLTMSWILYWMLRSVLSVEWVHSLWFYLFLFLPSSSRFSIRFHLWRIATPAQGRNPKWKWNWTRFGSIENVWVMSILSLWFRVPVFFTLFKINWFLFGLTFYLGICLWFEIKENISRFWVAAHTIIRDTFLTSLHSCLMSIPQSSTLLSGFHYLFSNLFYLVFAKVRQFVSYFTRNQRH